MLNLVFVLIGSELNKPIEACGNGSMTLSAFGTEE
jgi:hypothetical protein